MQIKLKYNIYKVFDGYANHRRELFLSVHSKREAYDVAHNITQKGLDIMGRINYWGEIEWVGFCIV
jgi:hypothetical protein